MMDQFLVGAEGIVKFYGRKKALDGISLGVKKGEVHVLLGRNGSGKTTLAKIVAGIMRPDSGRLYAGGLADRVYSPAFRRQVGFLFDSSAHWEGLTGKENARFFARSFGLGQDDAEARVDALLKEMALEEVAHDAVSTYSFGMRRKLAIVETLAHDPKLVVMDEPSIGLDFAARGRLYSILRSRAAGGSSVVVATNDMNEARHIADTVSLMESGRILVSGTPMELVNSLDGRVVIRVESKGLPRVDQVKRLQGVLGATMTEDNGTTSLQVMTNSTDEGIVLDVLLKHLTASGIRIDRIDLRRPELGDVFMKYAGGVARETG